MQSFTTLHVNWFINTPLLQLIPNDLTLNNYCNNLEKKLNMYVKNEIIQFTNATFEIKN